jgi:hypothetical protein
MTVSSTAFFTQNTCFEAHALICKHFKTMSLVKKILRVGHLVGTVSYAGRQWHIVLAAITDYME